MNTIEKLEMADRLIEILESGKMISLQWDSETQTTTAAIAGTGFSRFGHLDAIRACVDFTRDLEGSPGISETAEALAKADAKHAASPIVEIGPSAHCSCGSLRGLIIQRPAACLSTWQKGSIQIDNLPELWAEGQPGEIGTCPECGKAYKFGA